MINLFFVTFDFSGVRTYTNELLGYLSEQPDIAIHRIFIDSSVYQEYTEVQEANILNIYIPPIQKEGRSLEKYAARCMDLLDPLVRDKEHVIFHLNNALHVKLGLEARKRFGTMFIYTLHFLPNYFSYLDLNGTKPEEFITTGDALEREMVQEADQIICVTCFARKMLIDVFGCSAEKIVVIYNGCGKKIHSLLVTKEDQLYIRKKLGFNKTDLIVLFVGRLDKGKGIKFVTEAFNQVVKSIPQARLVFVGSGNFDEALRFAANNWGKITFTGTLSSKDLEMFYKAATIGVIPSIFEQCSYVALEMMLHGLPMIVSGVPGLRELFLNDENALIIPNT